MIGSCVDSESRRREKQAILLRLLQGTKQATRVYDPIIELVERLVFLPDSDAAITEAETDVELFIRHRKHD